MRVLVSGGAGFIGSHVVEALLAEGREVAVLDNLSTGRRENVAPSARLYEVDLRNPDAVRRAVADFRPTTVSHQAAQASVSVSLREPSLDAGINVLGGLHLLDACTEIGGVERVVFASTGGAIYGEVPEGLRATESTAARPLSPYAIHKLAFEQLLSVYRAHRGLATTTLRYANVYGPRQDPHGEAGVVAIFFDSVLAGRPLRINGRRERGDPGCLRDYVYVSDVVRMNLLAIAGRISEAVVNVGTGTVTTTNELARGIIDVSARQVPLEPAPPRAGDIERSVLDPTVTLHYLGQLVDLASGLDATHEYYAR